MERRRETKRIGRKSNQTDLQSCRPPRLSRTSRIRDCNSETYDRQTRTMGIRREREKKMREGRHDGCKRSVSPHHYLGDSPLLSPSPSACCPNCRPLSVRACLWVTGYLLVEVVLWQRFGVGDRGSHRRNGLILRCCCHARTRRSWWWCRRGSGGGGRGEARARRSRCISINGNTGGSGLSRLRELLKLPGSLHHLDKVVVFINGRTNRSVIGLKLRRRHRVILTWQQQQGSKKGEKQVVVNKQDSSQRKINCNSVMWMYGSFGVSLFAVRYLQAWKGLGTSRGTHAWPVQWKAFLLLQVGAQIYHNAATDRNPKKKHYERRTEGMMYVWKEWRKEEWIRDRAFRSLIFTLPSWSTSNLLKASCTMARRTPSTRPRNPTKNSSNLKEEKDRRRRSNNNQIEGSSIENTHILSHSCIYPRRIQPLTIRSFQLARASFNQPLSFHILDLHSVSSLLLLNPAFCDLMFPSWFLSYLCCNSVNSAGVSCRPASCSPVLNSSISSAPFPSYESMHRNARERPKEKREEDVKKKKHIAEERDV